jgi:hypothetical protein
MPSQYARLTPYLAKSGKAIVELSFAEIERILGKALPPSARSHPAWWANSGHYQAGFWTSAGYRVQRPDLRNGIIRFVRSGDSQAREASREEVPILMQGEASLFSQWRNWRSKWPVEKHLDALDKNFHGYLEKCAERRIFSGPSTYFYAQTIELVRSVNSLAALASAKIFHELVYATLTSWGMHRMGESVTAKLTEFHVFSAALKKIVESVGDLAGRSIVDLSDAEADLITSRLCRVVEKPGITASDAPLVANSKTLHFILPDLVPPMDRSYTGRFFFGPNKGMLLPGTPSENFRYMFSAFHRLGRRHADALKTATGKSYICLGHAKGLDNALIGYVLTHREHFPRPGRKDVPLED